MRNKLKEKNGGAMVLALMFFLLCTCVGVLVVTAASANAGKAAKMRSEEQTYQSVKAAANAFAQIMTNSPYTATYIEYYTSTRVPGGIAPDGTVRPPRDDKVTGVLKESVRDTATNGFAGDLGSLLGDSIRNIYLSNTTISTSQPLLNNAIDFKGATPSVWSTSEVTNLGPDKYELKLNVAGFQDILITLEINKGAVSGAAGSLYQATITAQDITGSHLVVLSSPATIVNTNTKLSETGDVSTKQEIETQYSTIISWDSWKVQ